MHADNLLADMQQAIAEYPGLKIINESGVFKLKGELDLIHPQYFSSYDSFEVEIYYPDSFPFSFPKVIETGGKIERCADRHINVADNNTLCLTVEPEELLLCLHGITTTRFIKEVLIPRLAEEHEVRKGNGYSHEFGHKAIGYWQYYSRVFGIMDQDAIIQLLQHITQHKMPKGFHNCYCGKGKKYKNCHRDFVYKFSSLGTSYISNQIQLLNKNKLHV